MTVYDRIRTMTKDELQRLIYYIYLWGHTNEKCGVDDECFYEHLLDLPSRHVDNIVDALDNLKLYKVCEVKINDGTPKYLDTRFFSITDTTEYLGKHIREITKVDDFTYATTEAIYKIIEC